MKNSPPLVDSSLEGLERTFDEESQTYSGERPPIQRSRLWNAAVGMMEKRRAYPSDRARKEYLDYYAGLYQDRGPNPAHFQEMLRRNGRPFMANPFPEGTREHYLYHPEGLVLADLEAILGNQVQDWKVTKEPSGEPEEHAKWPTIDEAITAQEGRLLEVEREWALLGGCAGACF